MASFMSFLDFMSFGLNSKKCNCLEGQRKIQRNFIYCEFVWMKFLTRNKDGKTPIFQ